MTLPPPVIRKFREIRFQFLIDYNLYCRYSKPLVVDSLQLKGSQQPDEFTFFKNNILTIIDT